MNSKTKTPEEQENSVSESRKRAEGTFTFGVSAFPLDLWNEWDSDCRQYYGDCRWIKMWDDHQKAKFMPILIDLLRRVDELEKKGKVSEIKADKVLTFGGEIGGD
jgi:hypothetical protein